MTVLSHSYPIWQDRRVPTFQRGVLLRVNSFDYFHYHIIQTTLRRRNDAELRTDSYARRSDPRGPTRVSQLAGMHSGFGTVHLAVRDDDQRVGYFGNGQRIGFDLVRDDSFGLGES